MGMPEIKLRSEVLLTRLRVDHSHWRKPKSRLRRR
jgi:hypothetical protein